MFVSAEYAAREWTRVERRTALARAVREQRKYVLPTPFDETPLPGLPSDMGRVDLRTWTPQQFAAMIADTRAALAPLLAACADAEAPPGASGRRVHQCGVEARGVQPHPRICLLSSPVVAESPAPPGHADIAAINIEHGGDLAVRDSRLE
jgi:hypothetical protein